MATAPGECEVCVAQRTVPACALAALPPPPAELLVLVEDAAALDAQVEEAVEVLKAHNATPPGGATRQMAQAVA